MFEYMYMYFPPIPPESKKSGIPTGTIAGGVIGGILLLIGIVVAAAITVWFIV